MCGGGVVVGETYGDSEGERAAAGAFAVCGDGTAEDGEGGGLGESVVGRGHGCTVLWFGLRGIIFIVRTVGEHRVSVSDQAWAC